MNCNFCLFFNFFGPKKCVFESFRWGIILLNFVGFPFKTFKFKNDINYIKYKFLHRFAKVRKWLNMYYSKIKIIILKKITTMSIWIILKNLVWTYRECNFCHYWATVLVHSPHIVCLPFNFFAIYKEVHYKCWKNKKNMKIVLPFNVTSQVKSSTIRLNSKSYTIV